MCVSLYGGLVLVNFELIN